MKRKLLVLMSFLLLVLPVWLPAEQNQTEVSTEAPIYVRGLVRKVYPEKMQISVRPVKGKAIRITIGPDTILEGLTKIDEFAKEQQVKVWYVVDQEGNRAIRIKKVMDLGC